MNNVTHLVSKRCPVTRLTKLQIAALANVCLGVSEHMPNGVYRSLVIRGLLTSTHTLTADGRATLANCTILSDKFRQLLLALPVVRASRRSTRSAAERSSRAA